MRGCVSHLQNMVIFIDPEPPSVGHQSSAHGLQTSGLAMKEGQTGPTCVILPRVRGFLFLNRCIWQIAVRPGNKLVLSESSCLRTAYGSATGAVYSPSFCVLVSMIQWSGPI